MSDSDPLLVPTPKSDRKIKMIIAGLSVVCIALIIVVILLATDTVSFKDRLSTDYSYDVMNPPPEYPRWPDLMTLEGQFQAPDFDWDFGQLTYLDYTDPTEYKWRQFGGDGADQIMLGDHTYRFAGGVCTLEIQQFLFPPNQYENCSFIALEVVDNGEYEHWTCRRLDENEMSFNLYVYPNQRERTYRIVNIDNPDLLYSVEVKTYSDFSETVPDDAFTLPIECQGL